MSGMYIVGHCVPCSRLLPASRQRPAATRVVFARSCRTGRESVEAGQATLRNYILAGMAAPDFARLHPNLEAVDLPLRKLLEVRHRRAEFAYFPESGIASVVVTGGSQHTVEVGMIGRESMTGQAMVLASDRSPHEVFMQAAGAGWRIGAVELKAALEESPGLRHHLLRHVQVFQTQMSFTALANARYRIDERLARWLLMAQDRLDTTDLPLTHEVLSLMLGVEKGIDPRPARLHHHSRPAGAGGHRQWQLWRARSRI
jgi:CRP-like cAMP-binding protein